MVQLSLVAEIFWATPSRRPRMEYPKASFYLPSKLYQILRKASSLCPLGAIGRGMSVIKSDCLLAAHHIVAMQ